VTASVVVLWIGWLALVAAAKLVWSAFRAVAEEGGGTDDVFAEVDATHRQELLREKRSLLRSIKDCEFDRDMGKMSEAQAGEILRVYRARAIEIIKQLEAVTLDDAAVSVDEAVERELAARLGESGRERTEAEAALYARRMQRIEEMERRDVHGFRMAGGLALAGLGVFVTLATYSAAAGGGYYVLWYGPIVSGLAIFAKGLHGWLQLSKQDRQKQAPEAGK
jgi:hypothetical protein